VNPERGSVAARRYLLGDASLEECSAIEVQYFGDEAAVDRIGAVEDGLIDDYLAGRLTADESKRFERHYLASPLHRTRVETIRRLSSMRGGSSRTQRYRWLAIAAAVIIGVGSIWMLAPRRQGDSFSQNRSASSPSVPGPGTPEPRSDRELSAPSPARQVFAVSLSPVSVRGVNEAPSLVIPAGTDTIALRLEGEANRGTIANARAAIRTVAGDEVWEGPATTVGDLPDGVVARVDVPAAQLRVDDYVVVLWGTDRGSAEQEQYRYFLRVRSR
jgi:anti-sigma factor RsiW